MAYGQSNFIVGTDGCYAGYVSLTREEADGWQWHLHRSAESWWQAFRHAEVVMVDVMLGLCDPQRPRRSCDAEARRRVGGLRACVVYSAPARAALAADSYSEACAINRSAVGRGVSQQCYALFPKIREMDKLLADRPAARTRVREGHPEVVFALANDGRAMLYSKKVKAGYAERLSVLQRLLPDADRLIAAGLEKFRRVEVARDDLVDAAILAAAADAGAHWSLLGIANPEVDAVGVTMNIYCPPRFMTFVNERMSGGRTRDTAAS